MALPPVSEDPVMRQQQTFRALLAALSHPGTACPLPLAGDAPPAAILKAVLTTLLDHEVGFALADAHMAAVSAEQITHWTHSPRLPVDQTDFLLVAGPDSAGRVLDLPRGTPQMPDQGATAIYLAPPDAAAGTRIALSGPGIPPEGRVVSIFGISADEMDAIRQVNLERPMGVDCFFLQPGPSVIGLPRSVSIGKG